MTHTKGQNAYEGMPYWGPTALRCPHCNGTYELHHFDFYSVECKLCREEILVDDLEIVSPEEEDEDGRPQTAE